VITLGRSAVVVDDSGDIDFEQRLMRVMCSGPAPARPSKITMFASVCRTWSTSSVAVKRARSSQPIWPARKMWRPRATTPPM